nr:peptidyl tRNA hydrolase 2 mitochondrial [Hymenolepis microstoma]
MSSNNMDSYSNLLTPLFCAGAGFIAGWYFRRGCPSKRAIMKMNSQIGSKLKLVLVVRTDLGMTKGKVAAQCSHATLGCYQKAVEQCPEVTEAWESTGQMKIVLQVPDYHSLTRLRESACDIGLPNCIVFDAGHTQVLPGTATVLGIGPADCDLIDTITGHLKLY